MMPHMGDTVQRADLVPCYIFSFDHTGVITSINPTFLSHLGYEADEVVGQRKFTSLLTVGSRIFFDTHFFPLIRLHGQFDEIFLSFLGKMGQELPVLLNVRLNGTEQQFEIICGGMKISQRNLYEKELLSARMLAEKALSDNQQLVNYRMQLEAQQEVLEKRLKQLSRKNKEHRQISAVMSHDLQEPLRKVNLFSSRLMQEVVGGECGPSIRQGLEKINSACRKMRELVVSLQKFVVLNENHLDIGEVSPGNLFMQEAEVLAAADATVTVRAGEMPAIRADRALLGNVFHELIRNSLGFRDPEKGNVVISLEGHIVEQNIFIELEHRYRYGEFLKLTYTDNGVGFEQKFGEEIFVLFRKAHDRAEGLGIGLAYCKKIVEMHGGSIVARSQPGEGSTFTILLPVSQD
jgi:phosphoserine phosphatase RsbU/P